MKVLKTTFIGVVGIFLFSACNNHNNNNPTDNFDVNEEVLTKAIDLGLPSGTLWADRNIGAMYPEDYGDYFSWGETEPKESYNWQTYKFSKGSKSSLTKYNTNSSFGAVDNKTSLEEADDVAKIRLGDSWQMPTEDDFEELRSKCTWIWTTQNGVKGYKVAGTNGNSIFLPTTGYCILLNQMNAGHDGHYWSSTLSDEEPYYAKQLSFDIIGNNLFVSNREYGITVRAVKL